VPNILETYEFNQLPDAGVIDPNRLRFAQPEISKDFSEPKHGDVYKLATSLAQNPALGQQIPPVEIGEFGSMVWSFDTRRLVAFQMAKKNNEGVLIRYRKIGAGGVKGRLDNFGGEGSRGGLVVGVRQGGKHSTRLIHQNPDYERVNLAPNLDFSANEFNSALSVLNRVTK
jgi:hypothetical protein